MRRYRSATISLFILVFSATKISAVVGNGTENEDLQYVDYKKYNQCKEIYFSISNKETDVNHTTIGVTVIDDECDGEIYLKVLQKAVGSRPEYEVYLGFPEVNRVLKGGWAKNSTPIAATCSMIRKIDFDNAEKASFASRLEKAIEKVGELRVPVLLEPVYHLHGAMYEFVFVNVFGEVKISFSAPGGIEKSARKWRDLHPLVAWIRDLLADLELSCHDDGV